MSISGLIIHARPEKTVSVRAELASLEGVEVHAVTPDGRLIVTVDQPDDVRASETLARLQDLDDALSTSLVCSYSEQDSAE